MITPGEFKLWLEGYLAEKNKLNSAQIAEISTKANEIAEGVQYFPYTYPWIYLEQPKPIAPQWTYTTWDKTSGATTSGIIDTLAEVKYA